MLVLLACAGTALAWNSPGHEQIADIAWTRLSNKTKQEVREILLAGDANFKPANNSTTSVRSAFMRAATFPDVIKHDHTTIYESMVVSLNPMWHPETDPLVSDRERDRCKTWHYYDTPILFTGAKPAVAKSNAIMAFHLIQDRLTELEQESVKDRREQAWWLCWIEHLTGDLHQPLHCTSSYKSGESDHGGNDLKLGLTDPKPPHDPLALHFYWDEGIDNAKQADRARGLSTGVHDVADRWSSDPALKPSAADIAIWDPAVWIKAGSDLAAQSVYTSIQPGGIPDSTYNAAQEQICKKQAVLAGYRLAALLNDILGK
jgi:hypothetical protein